MSVSTAVKSLLSIALVCGGCWLIVDDLAYLRSGKTAEATVTGGSRGGKTGRKVSVRFEADGQTRNATFLSVSSVPKGKRVEVLYLPDRPGRVHRSGSFDQIGVGVMSILGGLAYVVGGVLRLDIARR